ncbi:MAG: hypothetical protein N2644_01685 [Candidatus Sumerlaea chitinivorans]|jgi:hypothetical protein|nr:hypothetical protein [Candidatus Sumerlaea chitinivorans]
MKKFALTLALASILSVPVFAAMTQAGDCQTTKTKHKCGESCKCPCTKGGDCTCKH